MKNSKFFKKILSAFLAFSFSFTLVFTSVLAATPIKSDEDILNLYEREAPATPSSGQGFIYQKTDNLLYYKNDTGTEYDLTSATAGDVQGPASSIVDNIAVFADTTGKLIKDGLKKISDLLDITTYDPAGISEQVVGISAVQTVSNKTLADADSIDFDTAAGVSVGQGEIAWNADEETFDVGVNTSVVGQMFQENLTLVRNNTGAQLDDGVVVYQSGTVGASGRVTAEKYIANGTIDPHLILGVVTEDIPNAADGFVTSFGKVRGISTDGSLYSETWADDELLYASPTTAGGFTNIKPVDGNIAIPVASVINAHATNGTIRLLSLDHDQRGLDVELESLTGATYTTVQQMQDVFHSTGWVSGGGINDVGAGNITVDEGTGYIRPTTSEVDTLYPFDWSALGSTAIPSGTTRYVGVEYNAGSPQVSVRTTYNWDFQTNFPLGVVVNEGGTLHISNGKIEVGDHAGKMIQRVLNVNGIQRDNKQGGLIIGETGTRNLTLSAGTLWQGLTDHPVSAQNTSVSDTFAYYLGTTLDNGVATQWDNANYNNAGVKTALTANRWTNNWVYLETDGDIVILYGPNQYTSQAAAEDAPAPSTIPARITEGGRIIAQLTFQQGASSLTTIQSFFDTTATGSSASDHSNLSNLSWTTSGHTGTASTIAGFDGSGLATEISNNATADSTTTFTNKTFDANGTGNSLSNVGVSDLANGTDGELITWDATGVPATVPVGTAGQVLTSNGAGAAPTFQDAAGGGGSGDVFAVYASSNINATNGAFQKVSYQTEEVDDGGNYASGTYTAPSTGQYFFHGSISWTSTWTGSNIFFFIYKNGSEFKEYRITADATGANGANIISAVMDLTASDTVEFYVRQVSGTTKTIVADQSLSYAGGYRIK